MSIGGNPAVAGSVPLGSTVDKVMFNGNECDKVILDGTVIWERQYEISGSAVYNPTSRAISIDVNLGDLSSWSWRAVKNGGGGDTGENAVSGVNYAESNALGVSDDGVWTVTIKGFKNGVLKSTATTTVTVATPQISITSVVELTNSAPTYVVGDVVGISWYKQWTISENWGGDEDGGSGIDEYTRLYYLPFTGFNGYPQATTMNNSRFSYSGNSYNLGPTSGNDFTADHYSNSNENDYLWGGSKYGFHPRLRNPGRILMFNDSIFNKLKESDGKLWARNYVGFANSGTATVNTFFNNTHTATLNGKTYTFTDERVNNLQSSSYFKSGATQTLNDSVYPSSSDGVRRMYVVKIASIS